ncbi:MAG TPA: tRNA (adenosine(37)-N6)-dimethylallyltransferase MiaA [Drouetiella sp.]
MISTKNKDRDRGVPVVAIAGTTCAGKTRLSLELASKLDTEIICCDSRTVYKGMDIGTAKPTSDERARVQHHMLDLVEPSSNYTTAQFKEEASPILETLLAHRKSPIVCGGTGFYFRNLLEGLKIPAVEPQEELRKELNSFADQQGNQALHDKLQQLDPKSAARINANDRFRVVRAIEVTMYCGQPFSQMLARDEPPFEVIWIGLFCDDRNALMKMINDRLQVQIRGGLISEVESLYHRYGRAHSLLHTVGYAEVISYLDGEIDRETAIEQIALHTYQLSRKQLIWFRANKKINWFAVDQIPFAEIVSRTLTSCSVAEPESSRS